LSRTSAHPAAPLRGLYVCYVFSASIVVVSEAILAVMDTVRQTTNKRRKNRLWAPKGLRQLARALFVEKSTEGDPRAFGETREVKEVVTEEDGTGKYRKCCAGHLQSFNQHSISFRARSRQPTANKHLAKDYGGLTRHLPMDQNSKGCGTFAFGSGAWVNGLTIASQFVFRYVFLSVALWLPSVIRKTARKFSSMRSHIRVE
jgi:hypothetical protein